MAGSQPRPFRPEEDGSIDAELAMLLARTPRGVTLSQGEIARACGCSKAYIYLLEKSAMKKLRSALARRRLQEFI
jgi:transcriptional regulator